MYTIMYIIVRDNKIQVVTGIKKQSEQDVTDCVATEILQVENTALKQCKRGTANSDVRLSL